MAAAAASLAVQEPAGLKSASCLLPYCHPEHQPPRRPTSAPGFVENIPCAACLRLLATSFILPTASGKRVARIGDEATTSPERESSSTPTCGKLAATTTNHLRCLCTLSHLVYSKLLFLKHWSANTGGQSYSEPLGGLCNIFLNNISHLRLPSKAVRFQVKSEIARSLKALLVLAASILCGKLIVRMVSPWRRGSSSQWAILLRSSKDGPVDTRRHF